MKRLMVREAKKASANWKEIAAEVRSKSAVQCG